MGNMCHGPSSEKHAWKKERKTTYLEISGILDLILIRIATRYVQCMFELKNENKI